MTKEKEIASDGEINAENTAVDLVEGEPVEGAPVEDLEKLRADLLKFQDLALRSQADLDNFRKRMLREKEESIRYANAGLLEKLLPVLDSFELGLQAAAQSEQAAELHQGFSLVQKQLQDFLREQGVEPIEAVGAVFDPNLHEAVSQMTSADHPEGQVCQQIRKGYRLRERLLRPAMVIVSKGPENSA
jgi:molecular chaperone GrpE